MPTTYQEHKQQATALFARANTILIVTHASLDGDGLASAIALHLFLRKLGKSSTVICPEPVPEAYHFLPGVEQVRADAQSLRDCVISVDFSAGTEIDNVRYAIEEGRINIVISPRKGEILPDAVHFRKSMDAVDLIVTLDTPNKQALGPVYEQNVDLFYAVPVINIDHHVENSYYGRVNVVDVSAASTTEILTELMPAIAPDTAGALDDDIATLLLAGLITDTMSFQNARTTPRALHVASALLKLGARQQEIIRHLYKTKKLSTLKLWGRILGNVEHDHLRRVLWSEYSYRDLDEFAASEKEVAGIMDNLLANAPGMEVVTLFSEKSPSETHLVLKFLADAIDQEQFMANLAPVFVRQNGHLVARKPLTEAKKEVLPRMFSVQQSRLGITQDQLNALSRSLSEQSQHIPIRKESDASLPEVKLSEIEGKLGGE